MRRLPLLCTAAALVAATAPAIAHADADETRAGSVYARVTGSEVVLGNAVAERRWSRDALRTTALTDKRGQDRSWSSGSRDFSLTVGAATIGSEQFSVDDVKVTDLPRGGLRVTMSLSGVPGLAATRTVEAYDGIAGFRTQTTVTPAVPLPLRGATLDEAAVGSTNPAACLPGRGRLARARLRRTRPRPGRQARRHLAETTTAPAGEPLDGPGEWLSEPSRRRPSPPSSSPSATTCPPAGRRTTAPPLDLRRDPRA